VTHTFRIAFLNRLPFFLFLVLIFVSCATVSQPTIYSRAFSEDSRLVWDVFQERLTRRGLPISEKLSIHEGPLKFYLELSDQDILTYTQGPHDANLSHGVVTIKAWIENLDTGGSQVMLESSIDAYTYERRASASFSNRNYSRPRLSPHSKGYFPVELTSNGVLEYELLGYSREESIELSHVKSIQDEFTRIKEAIGRNERVFN